MFTLQKTGVTGEKMEWEATKMQLQEHIREKKHR